jgi:hypothetical protein
MPFLDSRKNVRESLFRLALPSNSESLLHILVNQTGFDITPARPWAPSIKSRAVPRIDLKGKAIETNLALDGNEFVARAAPYGRIRSEVKPNDRDI